MKTETKQGYWVEGFDRDDEEMGKYLQFYPNNLNDILYSGKTSDITEEIAKECVRNYPGRLYYMDYRDLMYQKFKTAKESIQSALTKPDKTIYNFCIIWREK